MQNKLLIVGFILFLFPSLSLSNIVINYDNLDDYWVPDSEAMMSVAGPIEGVYLIEKTNSRPNGIWYQYEFDIDKKGRSRNFKYIGASEEVTDDEIIWLEKMVLFYRYKPGKNNPNKNPVKVKANVRHWKGHSKK